MSVAVELLPFVPVTTTVRWPPRIANHNPVGVVASSAVCTASRCPADARGHPGCAARPRRGSGSRRAGRRVDALLGEAARLVGAQLARFDDPDPFDPRHPEVGQDREGLLPDAEQDHVATRRGQRAASAPAWNARSSRPRSRSGTASSPAARGARRSWSRRSRELHSLLAERPHHGGLTPASRSVRRDRAMADSASSPTQSKGLSAHRARTPSICWRRRAGCRRTCPRPRRGRGRPQR